MQPTTLPAQVKKSEQITCSVNESTEEICKNIKSSVSDFGIKFKDGVMEEELTDTHLGNKKNLTLTLRYLIPSVNGDIP
jgi:hypothetical protein